MFGINYLTTRIDISNTLPIDIGMLMDFCMLFNPIVTLPTLLCNHSKLSLHPKNIVRIAFRGYLCNTLCMLLITS